MAKNQTILDKAQVTTEMVTDAVTASSPKFSKEQLVKSQRYVHRRDALNALLADDKTYSFAQVNDILNKFDKGGND